MVSFIRLDLLYFRNFASNLNMQNTYLITSSLCSKLKHPISIVYTSSCFWFLWWALLPAECYVMASQRKTLRLLLTLASDQMDLFLSLMSPSFILLMN